MVSTVKKWQVAYTVDSFKENRQLLEVDSVVPVWEVEELKGKIGAGWAYSDAATGGWTCTLIVVDVDAKHVDEAIANCQRIKNSLENRRVDLDTVPVFASGKKGFHVFIPVSALGSGAIPEGGLPNLAAVAKRFIFDVAGWEFADPAMYVGGQGQLCRLPNVERIGVARRDIWH